MIKWLLVVVLLAGSAYWFHGNYRVMPVVNGTGDYMVLKDTQAKECLEGGGCAIYSKREFQAFMTEFQKYIVQRLMEMQQQSLRHNPSSI